jgi:hypothetical protein
MEPNPRVRPRKGSFAEPARLWQNVPTMGSLDRKLDQLSRAHGMPSSYSGDHEERWYDVLVLMLFVLHVCLPLFGYHWLDWKGALLALPITGVLLWLIGKIP